MQLKMMYPTNLSHQSRQSCLQEQNPPDQRNSLVFSLLRLKTREFRWSGGFCSWRQLCRLWWLKFVGYIIFSCMITYLLQLDTMKRCKVYIDEWIRPGSDML